MKEYVIPVTLSVKGIMKVNAHSLREAVESVQYDGLPDKPKYVDDTFRIVVEEIPNHNQLDNWENEELEGIEMDF